MKPKLQVCRVSFSYHSKHKETLALSDISFTVEHGEFVAILGPSGCGKSTLLSLICGLDEPEAGAIFLDGELLEKNPGNAFHIGYMFQKDQLFEWRDILSNVSLGLEIQHQLTDDRKKNCLPCFLIMDLPVLNMQSLLLSPAACAREPPLYAPWP